MCSAPAKKKTEKMSLGTFLQDESKTQLRFAALSTDKMQIMDPGPMRWRTCHFLVRFPCPNRTPSRCGFESDASIATESRSGYGGERRAFSSNTGMGNGYNGNAHHSGCPFIILMVCC